MYTECPSCKTLFRITEEQLVAVGGQVRCGFCYGTFSAYDSLYQEADDESSAPQPAPSRPTTQPPPQKKQAQPQRPPAEPPAAPAPPPRSTPGPGFVEQRQPVYNPPQQTPPPAATAPPRNNPSPPTASAPAAPPRPAPPPTPAMATAGVNQLPNLFDAIDMAGRELQQVTRSQLDTRRFTSAASLNELAVTAGWGVAALLLVGLMIGQYGYFRRDQLAQYPLMRPWLERLCAIAKCDIPLVRSPSLIKLVSRDIQKHPGAKDALQVRLTIINDAAFTQPYPILRLVLSDISGNTVASRQFQPTEYLKSTVNADKGIASKEKIDIQLDILDPDQNAVGFEFTFL